MSPTAVDRLDKTSKKGQVQAATSDCIAAEIRRGKSQDEAIAMCLEMARKKTGGQPPKEGA